jgi:hypothetical protein
VMLSDENDCSVADHPGNQAFFVTSAVGAPKATAACETDPNSPCCRPCALQESSPPAGCLPLNQDVSCQASNAGFFPVADTKDEPNLRCYRQKQRFGIDFLWKTQRYVDGLTKPVIKDYSGKEVLNPLFKADTGKSPRSPQQVLLAGIVGVPWQDIATRGSLDSSKPNELEYLTYAGLAAPDAKLGGKNRWDLMLGDPTANVDPLDGLMIESVDPRMGKSNPVIANGAIKPATSLNPQDNPINGHEADYSKKRFDLQYACIYRLPAGKVCTAPTSCDCVPDGPATIDELRYNRPVCNPPGGGAAQSTQYYGKAYPGLRHLQVLKDFGAITGNAVVASACPKILDTAQRASGYVPALDALVDRMKEGL